MCSNNITSDIDFDISFDFNDTFVEIEEKNQSVDDEAFKVCFNFSFDNDLEPIQAKTEEQSIPETEKSPIGIS